MNLEELNTTQVILLTLLVSFVTSIATGIVTVSLMAQAPQGITQTINRVIERTVEKVVPDTSVLIPQTTEKTVIVKEDDAIADSLSKVRNSVIRIVAKDSPDSAFYARGLIVDAKGVAVTSKGVLSAETPSEAILPSGVRVPFTVRKTDSSSIAVLELDLKNATTSPITPVAVADVSKARLGSTVLLLSGKGRDTVGQGIISALPTGAEGRGSFIEATIESTFPGAVIVNIFGSVVGLVTTDSSAVDTNLYTPSTAIVDALKPPAPPAKAP
jgi:hypothetical protein